MEINFCPKCNASEHKILNIKDSLYFCKECNMFFFFAQKKLKCVKCNSTNIVDSEFPAPDGSFIFQCRQCKKMFPARELFEYNKI